MQPIPASLHRIRYGSDEPLAEQKLLRAGQLTALFEEGGLKNIRFGQSELVLGLYSAVRDHNWGTIAPQFTEMSFTEQPDVFEVAFTAVHQNADVHFEWKGYIRGEASGRLEFTMDGIVRRQFAKNRIGFCILHPMALAGTPLQVKTPEGVISGKFPEAISPHQPFFQMEGMQYTTQGEVSVELDFEGDVFEMEDQRNWTDASYKTYCTPLSQPYPVEVQPGDQIRQKITLQATAHHSPDAAESSSSIPSASIVVQAGQLHPVPSIGTLLPKHALTTEEIECIRKLQLGHVRVELNLTSGLEWKHRLREALSTADGLKIELEIDVVSSEHGEGLSEFVHALDLDSVNASGITTITRLFVYNNRTHTSSERLLNSLRNLLSDVGLSLAVGGGSRAYFAQFNRASLPLDSMEWATYSINPQVHAFDQTSLVETLTAQAATVDSANRMTGNMPLSIGPVTLKKRYNPDATSISEMENEDDSSDPRQTSLFCAGWTLGSLRNLLQSASVKAVTYYETLGDKGFAEHAEHVYPVYHIMADIGELKGGYVCPLHVSHPLKVEALAICNNGRSRLWIANMTNECQVVSVELAGSTKNKVRKLDENTFIEAVYDAKSYRSAVHDIMEGTTDQLVLQPYGVIRIDSEIT
ncbi:hypothetical protein [Paenibacillus thalictri]|uniref:Uncharacterized protein n=1 Tax=Paenibacillus thalictri TaxID=2527873 RepID=A0A4Q9DGH9_9BACL|nr:hypothetical protein [Paenibacillus thalictri]TBL70308.1 hypothetical protein EYB31_33885 [Paenibacillus thalictri]